jgi:ankyrin repeat protein
MSEVRQLVRAAFNGYAEEVARLVDAGVPIDAQADDNSNPLHAAIENDQIECIRMLVSKGADVNLTVNGISPLAHAVDLAIDSTIQSGGDQDDEPVEAVRYLLSVGADPSSGLAIARAYGSKKLVALLEAAQERHLV